MDRNLLPVAPLTIVLLALGVAALAAAPSRWLRLAGIAVAVAAVIAVGSQTRTERELFATDSYFLDRGNSTLLSHLPPHPGPVDLEGYGISVRGAVPELTLMYALVSEDGYEVSVPNEAPSFNHLKALGTANYIDPRYRYVLTRFGGIQTGRRVLARAGPLALEERVGPLDATLVSGALTSLVHLEAQGVAQVVEALHMLVIGGGAAPAWIWLRLQTIDPASAPSQPGVRARWTAHTLTACVRATGTAPVRHATLQLAGHLLPGIVPAEPFAEREPPQGIQLVAMRAVTHCSPGAPAEARPHRP